MLENSWDNRLKMQSALAVAEERACYLSMKNFYVSAENEQLLVQATAVTEGKACYISQREFYLDGNFDFDFDFDFDF